ncbi:MAG: right-handed parallel beta-helix repeat-containing protein, partial [Pseudomonadota bacterium]
MLGVVDPAHAVSCGEVVGPGERRVLTKNLTCDESPALIVEGPIVLDLRGLSITCTRTEAGALRATGIQVTGSQAEIRKGKVKNCHRGLDVRGNGNHLIERLTVTSAAEAGGSDHMGFLVQSDNNQLLRNIVRNYAGEGFRLDGADLATLKRNQAIGNADHGFRVRQGRGNVFWRNKAQGNQGEGFRSQDRDNRFEANTALNNGDEGIRLRDAAARNSVVIDNFVKKNGRSPCDAVRETPDANPGIAVTRGSGSNLISGNK